VISLIKLLQNLDLDSNILITLLRSNSIISEDQFNPITGQFTHHLNELLRYYADQDSVVKDSLRPYINYYRQVQNYLVFLLRFPDILKVPHHSEIQQTLNILENREILLKTTYAEISDAEKRLFEGEFRDRLNDLFKHKQIS
jgi:hypothetical protein